MNVLSTRHALSAILRPTLDSLTIRLAFVRLGTMTTRQQHTSANYVPIRVRAVVQAVNARLATLTTKGFTILQLCCVLVLINTTMTVVTSHA